MSDCGDVQKAFVDTHNKEAQKEIKDKKITGVSITEKAAERIKHFCQVDGKDAKQYGLKVSVVSDGCSGKSYTMDLAPIEGAKKNGDKLFTRDGATLIVDKLSYMFVIGSELDYKETLLASGFELVNPNIKGACSCGSSFSV